MSLFIVLLKFNTRIIIESAEKSNLQNGYFQSLQKVPPFFMVTIIFARIRFPVRVP